MERDPSVVEEIFVETPIAKLAAKGIRISDILSIITAAAIAMLLYILIEHKADAKDAWDAVTVAMAEHTKAIREQTKAQHLTTCIMSLPMELRKKEFADPKGFCRRMVDVP